MYVWEVMTDGLKVAVKTGAEEISVVDGTVTFYPGDPVGVRCANEIVITPDILGARGEGILSRIRTDVPSVKVTISPHFLNIYCAEQGHVSAALTTIGDLSPARLRPELIDTRWRGDRMLHYEISPCTPLTTISGNLGFDDAGNNVPFRLLHDLDGLKLQEGDLTKLGEQFLARFVEFARRLGVGFVTLSRTCFEFCLLAPCEEERKPGVAALIEDNLSFALA
jgi:hypothetical protein